MKKYGLLLAGLVFLTSSAGYGQVNLHSGLQAYYPFSGNAKDMSGNGHDGVIYNATPAADKNGNGNSAFYFNGASSISAANFSPASFTGMTFAAWIKSDKTSPRSTIMQHGGGVMYTNLFTERKLVTAFDGSGNNNSTADQTNADVVTNSWQHVVATNDGTTTRQYVNGVLEKSYSETYLQASNGLYIGLQINGQWGFTGNIDEVYIYNRALTGDEAAALYNGGLAGISEADKTVSDIVVYPNPTAGREIFIETGFTGSYELKLMTPEGKEEFRSTISASANEGRGRISLDELPAGLYFLSIHSSTGIVTRGIVLQ
jgi:hypothetical protein